MVDIDKKDVKLPEMNISENPLCSKVVDLDLENRFSYHKPNGEQQEIYPLIRDKAKEFAYMIKKYVPNGREQLCALTKLEEVVMWANAGISRN